MEELNQVLHIQEPLSTLINYLHRDKEPISSHKYGYLHCQAIFFLFHVFDTFHSSHLYNSHKNLKMTVFVNLN